eukprot:gene3129-3330_t
MMKLDDDERFGFHMNDLNDITSLTENNFQEIDDLLLELLEDDGDDDDDSEPSSPTEGEGEGGSALEEIPENLEIKLYRMKVIQGQDQFVQMLGLNYLMMPDSFFRLTDVKVCQTLNISGSRIILHSEMTGTMLYEVMNSHSRPQQHHQQRTITDGGETNGSQHVCSNELQNAGPTLQILRKPFEYTLDTVLTMQLDENHRIISFILNVLNTKERSIEV